MPVVQRHLRRLRPCAGQCSAHLHWAPGRASTAAMATPNEGPDPRRQRLHKLHIQMQRTTQGPRHWHRTTDVEAGCRVTVETHLIGGLVCTRAAQRAGRFLVPPRRGARQSAPLPRQPGAGLPPRCRSCRRPLLVAHRFSDAKSEESGRAHRCGCEVAPVPPSAASYDAKASGAEREPGHNTTCSTPSQPTGQRGLEPKRSRQSQESIMSLTRS